MRFQFAVLHSQNLFTSHRVFSVLLFVALSGVGIRIQSVVAAEVPANSGIKSAEDKQENTRSPKRGPSLQQADRISGLIEQLGSDRYRLRERAQRELEELSNVAYDQLLEASLHRDPEIAMRAKQTAATIRKNACDQIADAALRDEMRRYFASDEPDRKNSINNAHTYSITNEKHSKLTQKICTIVQYEQNPELAKLAALKFLVSWAKNAERNPSQSQEVQALLSNSQRIAAKWLMATTAEKQSAESLQVWVDIVDREIKEFERQPNPENLLVVQQLLRFIARLHLDHGQRDKTKEFARKLLALENDDPANVPALLEWIIEIKAWEMGDELIRKFPSLLTQADLKSLYLIAEMYQIRGEQSRADELVKRALATNPDNATLHLYSMGELYSRGLNQWAKQEGRVIVDNKRSLRSDPGVRACVMLSEIYQDEEDYAAATNVLAKAIETLSQERSLIEAMSQESESFSYAHIKSNYHCLLAKRHHDDKKHDQELIEYREAYRQDPMNVDCLIGWYKCPNLSKRDLTDVQSKIDKTARNLEERILQGHDMRTSKNHFAWLIANTEGDLDKALEYALSAIEIDSKNGAILDTVAHCYFAKKDYQAAVKHQSRAVELAPYSQTIKRSLAKFEKALANSKSSSTESPKN